MTCVSLLAALATIVITATAAQAAVIWDNPALSQFPSQWVKSQLQSRSSYAHQQQQQQAANAMQQQRLQRPVFPANVPPPQPQPLSPLELQQQQQQFSALLAPYLSQSADSVAAYAPSAFSDSTLNFDNTMTPDDGTVSAVDGRDLLFNSASNNNNNDALSPYAMDLLREAYLAQVPVAEFRPIYGNNNNAGQESSKTATLKTAATADGNNKLVPSNLNDIERMFAESLFGPIVAGKTFRSLDNNKAAGKAESKAFVETADNMNRNAYSKLTNEELKLNKAEKRLSDLSNSNLVAFGGDEGGAASVGGAFGSSAHAINMFAGKSRLSVMAIVFACTGAAIFGVIAAATFYRRVKTRHGHGNDSNYPAYGVTGPIKPPSSLDLTAGDRKLAKSAETYHYQNQKRAMLASERHTGLGAKSAAAGVVGGAAGDESDSDLDEGSECGDYTVYECPGLAPAGCMEVQNPLFIGSDAESISPRSDRAEE